MKYLMLLPLFVLPQGPSTKDLKTFNINFMLRGYFYAASENRSGLAGLGGWGSSDNGSSPFIRLPGKTGLEILVDTTAIVPLEKEYEGRWVTVRNHGPATLYFPAQDSRLYMKTQALRANAFADIEYLPSSWCGNSYHTLYLAAGEQWAFIMPKYEGKRATHLRLELQHSVGPDRGDNTEMVYSHTFLGGVNPKQFTEKQGHNPQGLMDPYFE